VRATLPLTGAVATRLVLCTAPLDVVEVCAFAVTALVIESPPTRISAATSSAAAGCLKLLSCRLGAA
jgi:hypothetical protein